MDCDVCIVGAGVMGASTAYWLSKTKGLTIVLLDQYGVGNGYCSSNDFNRVFRYAYGKDEFYTLMAVESLRLWRTIEHATATRLLIQAGLLMLQGTDTDARNFNEESYDTLTRFGLGAQRIPGNILKMRFPQFNADSAILDPHGGILLASKVLQLLAKLAKRQGVQILEKKVTKIIGGEGPIVETSTGERVSCEKALITVGSWTNSLRPEKLPSIVPTRQQVAYFKPEKIAKFQPESFPVFFTDQHYGLPAEGIGGGVKISNKKQPRPVDPDADRAIDNAELDACRKICGQYIPDLAEADLVQAKVCIYDMTGNSDFVVGPDPETPHVIYGYGFSGHGFKFAPLIGKLLAEIALERPPSFDIDRLDPSVDHKTQPAKPY